MSKIIEIESFDILNNVPFITRQINVNHVVEIIEHNHNNKTLTEIRLTNKDKFYTQKPMSTVRDLLNK